MKGDTQLLGKLVELASSATPKTGNATPPSKPNTDLGSNIRRRRVPSYAHSQIQTDNLGSLNESAARPTDNVPKVEWLPDKVVNNCLVCDVQFTFVRRKHHCRLCGGIFCNECSSHDVDGQRACDICYERKYGVRTRRLKSILGASASLPPPLVSVSEWKETLRSKRKDLGSQGVKSRVKSNRQGSSHTKPGIKAPQQAQHAVVGASVNQETTVASSSEGRSVGDGDDNDNDEETSVRFNERLRQLESESEKLRATISAASTPAALHPTFSTVATRSEFWFPIIYMCLWMMNKLGWKLAVYGGYITILLACFFYMFDSIDFVSPVVCSAISKSGVPYANVITQILCDHLWLKLSSIGLVVTCAYIHYVAASESDMADLLRRRMRVYGISLGILADYKITEMYTEQHYEEIDDEQESVKSAGEQDGAEENEATEQVNQDVIDVDEIWASLHRRNARRLYCLIRDLKGLWVKCGQYLSSRPDVMPPEYIQVLRTLQDGMPARPLSELMQTVSEDVGKDTEKIFKQIDPHALASASIAQVHKGTLSDGSHVAIKVQHRGMDKVLRQDLKNLHHVLSVIGIISPNLDIKSVMEEWSKQISSELDFEREAENMIAVRQNMARSGLNVTLPRVIPGLYGPRALVMRYVDGVKVSDRYALDEAGVDREKLVADVCTAYGCQIYINGVFNGDPHPGNILVIKRKTLRRSEPELQKLLKERYHCDPDQEKPNIQWKDIQEEQDDETASLLSLAHGHDDDWVPVLIDFGLTKRLDDQMRYAFCQMVISGEEMDYAGVLESFDNMGMKFNRESVSEDLENLQHMFRDAKPADEARKEHRARNKRKKKAQEAEKKEGKEERKIEAWPSDLMFFLRASELLQGLCVQLDTRLKFMSIMAGSARVAMLRRFPRSLHARRNVYPLQENTLESGHASQAYQLLLDKAGPPACPPTLRDPVGGLESKLMNLCGALFDQGHILGAQVCVVQRGKVLADVAAGKLGSLDPRPVTPASLFPVYGVSRAVVASIFSEFIRKGKLPSLDEPVSKVWPEFAAAGKSRCTIRELLLCRSGVEAYCPNDLSSNHLTENKWDEMVKQVAKSDPSLMNLPVDKKNKAASVIPAGPSAPGEILTHLYLGWGWAIGGVLEKLSETSAAQALQKEIAECLPVANEIYCGHHTEVDFETFHSRMATVLLGKADREINLESEDKSCEYLDGRDIVRLPGGLTGHVDKNIASMHIQEPEEHDEDAAEEQSNVVTLSAGIAAIDFAEKMNESGLEEFVTLTSGGKEHIMDPRVLNMEKLKRATLPATNMRCSARALASLGDRFFSSLKQTVGNNEPQLVFDCDMSTQEARERVSTGVERLLHVDGQRIEAPAIDMEGNRAVVYVPERVPGSTQATISDARHQCNVGSLSLEACRSYGFRPVGFTKDHSGDSTYSGYGMFALGGSLLMTEADSGTTIAITVNELTSDSKVTRFLLERICSHLQLGQLEK